MRATLSVLSGFVVWWIAASIMSLGLKSAWPDYAAAEPQMQFTFGMMAARLTMGALSTLAAGWVTHRLSISSRYAALGLGVLLLLFFIPVHIKLFAVFPLWYHILFLGSLVPLAILPHWLSNSKMGPRAFPSQGNEFPQ
ncbi:MAG: hypothetical protein ACKOPE_03270 [Novosphingobium sp.]